jgi:hypothetical protein
MNIQEYYRSRGTTEAKAAFREKVMKRCDMSYPTFMSRIPKNKWKKLEIEAIEEIIKSEQEEKSDERD